MSARARRSGGEPTEGAVESMLSRALAPVEPPAHLYDKLERRFEHTALAAAEELLDWELAAMRDPRNWVRPAVALVAGSAAAGALVVMHLRSKRRGGEADVAVKAVRSALVGVRREFGRSATKFLK